MARPPSLRIKGIVKTSTALANPAAFGGPYRKFFIRVGAIGRNSAKRRTPVDSGFARSRWELIFDERPVPLFVKLRNDAWYSHFLDKGTRPHYPRTKGALKAWADARGLNVYAIANTMKKGKGRGKRPKAVRGRFMRLIARRSIRKQLPRLTAQTAQEISRLLLPSRGR